MYRERGSTSRQIELIPASEQYWVLFTDVTCADVNKVLEIYEEATERSAAPIEEEDFERLKSEFENRNAFTEWEISKGRTLEWRRLVAPEGPYIRFKIGGADIHRAYRVPRTEETIRTRINDYFKDRSKSLTELT